MSRRWLGNQLIFAEVLLVVADPPPTRECLKSTLTIPPRKYYISIYGRKKINPLQTQSWLYLGESISTFQPRLSPPVHGWAPWLPVERHQTAAWLSKIKKCLSKSGPTNTTHFLAQIIIFNLVVQSSPSWDLHIISIRLVTLILPSHWSPVQWQGGLFLMPRIARPARQRQCPLSRLGGVDHFAQVALLIRGQQQSRRLTRLAVRLQMYHMGFRDWPAEHTIKKNQSYHPKVALTVAGRT